MFSFLRKIRRVLVDSGSTRKYILYALGEIALVVIGILIALQINNWNEDRNKRARIGIYLTSLIEDLHDDRNDPALIGRLKGLASEASWQSMSAKIIYEKAKKILNLVEQELIRI